MFNNFRNTTPGKKKVLIRKNAKNKKAEDVEEKKKCLMLYGMFPLKFYIKHKFHKVQMVTCL